MEEDKKEDRDLYKFLSKEWNSAIDAIGVQKAPL